MYSLPGISSASELLLCFACRRPFHSCRQQFATKCGNFKASHSHVHKSWGHGSVGSQPSSDVDYRSHLTKKRLIYKHINNMRCGPTAAK